MNNKFELIQKGNQYRLTKEQHFIPASHIKRFYNLNKKIFCKNLVSKNKKISAINTNDSTFKVQRLWAEFAEKGYMKSIEDNFNKLVDDILNEKIKKFNQEQSRVICDMYTLWERRIYHIEEFEKNLELNIKFNGIKGDIYSQNEKEKIESMHMSFIDENNEIPSRDIIAGQIQVYILDSPYKNLEWGILKSNKKQFVFPSNPFMKNTDKKTTIIYPISPHYCLCPTAIYHEVCDKNVEKLNEVMINNSKWFYFWSDENN